MRRAVALHTAGIRVRATDAAQLPTATLHRRNTMKEMTALSAAIDFFGLKQGQSRMDFARDEWKKLNDADKDEIKSGLEQNGYKIVAVA
jgi:hypothetical protein